MGDSTDEILEFFVLLSTSKKTDCELTICVTRLCLIVFFCHYYQTIPSLKCRSDIISDRGYEHFFFFLFALFFFLTFFSHFLCICVSFGVNYDSSKFDRKLKGSWEIRLFQYRLRIQSFSIRSFQLERH